MTIDTTRPRTRRAVLIGALGGAAASVAATMGRTTSVDAANGDAVKVGNFHRATAVTVIDAVGAPGFGATSDVHVGVTGDSDSNWGIYGHSKTRVGVYGASDTHIGVKGYSDASDLPAIVGQSNANSTGVLGYSGTFSPPVARANTGVFGFAIQDDSARGVTGQSAAGRGVFGIATNGTGVFGVATNGTGVFGKSEGGEAIRGVSIFSNGTAGTTASGIASGVYGENTGGGYGTYGRSNMGAGYGVFGESTAGTGVTGNTTTGVGVWAVSLDTGIALKAQGRVSFSTSGLAAVTAGTRSQQVTPGSDLVANSHILCTLESNQAGLSIEHLTKNTTANTFTVTLSSAVKPGKYARLAWFVIG